MFRKDYLLRIIEEAVKLLAKALNLIKDGDLDEAEKIIAKTYELLEANPEWLQMNIIDIIKAMEQADFDFQKMEIMAELMKVEAAKNEALEQMNKARKFLIKSLAIYEYVDNNSTTYSFERMSKITQLKEQVN